MALCGSSLFAGKDISPVFFPLIIKRLIHHPSRLFSTFFEWLQPCDRCILQSIGTLKNLTLFPKYYLPLAGSWEAFHDHVSLLKGRTIFKGYNSIFNMWIDTSALVKHHSIVLPFKMASLTRSWKASIPFETNGVCLGYFSCMFQNKHNKKFVNNRNVICHAIELPKRMKSINCLK